MILALIVITALIDRQRRSTAPKLASFGDLSKLELSLRGTRSSLRFDRTDGRTDGQGHWRLESFADKPAIDSRANENMVIHLIDLIRALKDQTTSPLNAQEANAYGMTNPELAVTLIWDKPAPGHETVLFGHRDISGRRVFAFFPDRPLLVEVPAVPLTLIESKDALDVRDRRITTFEPDDVEDLVASGKCGSFKLSRDGDRWLLDSSAIAVEDTERWLSELLESKYEQIDDTEATARKSTASSVCKLVVIGRRDRRETIEIFKSDGALWTRNSALASTYRLPSGFLSLLVPPRNAKTTAR